MSGRSPIAVLVLCVAACGAASPRPDDASALGDPLDSISPEELYRRGELLAQGGDYIRAEQYIAAAIQRGFPEDRAMPALLSACVEGSRLVSALQYAEPYLARHPREWSLRMLVASIHMGLDNDARARDELLQVVRDAPTEAQPHYFLGVLYRDRLADEAQAAEHFRQYLALAPDGEHRDEAQAGLTGRPRLPERVPMPEETSDEPSAPTPEATE